MLRPELLKGYMLAKLPLGAIAGMKMTRLDDEVSEATVPFTWRTRNPFGSIYFAVLCMAAELSTAGFALMAARGGTRSVAALPVGLKANFVKKATSRTTFRCEAVEAVREAVAQTLATGEAVTLWVETVGRDAAGEVVAEIALQWSFKRRGG